MNEIGASALSSGLGFVANLGGSVGGGLFSANQARKNRAFQERMYNKQVEDNIKFWNMQNEYNLPSAQIERLRNALPGGLNPLLMYGEGGISGNLAQQQVQSGTAPHGSQGSVGSFNTRLDLANLALVEAQAKALNSQANVNDSAADLNKSKTAETDFDVMFKNMNMELDRQLKFGQLDLNGALIRDYNSQIWSRENLSTQQVLSMVQSRLYEVKRFNWEVEYQGKLLDQGWKQLELTGKSVSAQLSQAAAAMIHARAAARLSDAQVGLFSQEYAFNIKNNPLRLGASAFDVLAKQAGWKTEQARTFERTFKNEMLKNFGSESTGEFYRNVAPIAGQLKLGLKNLMDPRWWCTPLGDYHPKK